MKGFGDKDLKNCQRKKCAKANSLLYATGQNLKFFAIAGINNTSG
jgi:hypothetical protein